MKDSNELLHKLLEDLQIISEDLAEYINSPSWNRPTFYNNDDEHSIQYKKYLENSSNAIAPVLPTEEPDNSISIGDKHLSTILKIESDEVIKSSVKNLVPILSKSEVTSDNESECDVPVNDESSLIFTTFSNHLFDYNDNFTSTNDESLSNEDVLIENFKIYLNSLFDDEESISTKIDLHYFNDESNLLESLLNRDTLIDSSPKFDYFLDEFSGEHAQIDPISLKIEEADFDLEEEIHIESDDYDSKGDIHFLEELLSTLPLPKNESSNFDYHDDPSFPRPPPKPLDVEGFFDFEPDTGVLTAKVVEDIFEHYVLMPKVLPSQPTLCPNFDTLLPFSSDNKDKVFKSEEGSYELKDLDAYTIRTTLLDDALPTVKKDLGSFTLLCIISNLCFHKALADLGASVSVMPFLTYTKLGLGELAPTKLIVELYDRTIKHPKGISKNVLVGIEKFVFLVNYIILDMLEDIKTPLILGRPFLSTAHAKIDVLKRKITLKVGNDKVVFKSEKPTSNIIKRVYMLSLRERMKLDIEARLIEEALILNRSLNRLKIHIDCVYNLQFTCMIDFTVVENVDAYREDRMGDIIVGRPFCRKACVRARRFDGMIIIYKWNDSVTYQMERSYPRFKHLTNAQCNKMRPLQKVSAQDELKGTSHPYQNLKGFYNEVLNLGLKYIMIKKVEEWLTHGHVSIHETE
uniref:Reverse transcriptase domain-containing protein n=1 Tax=Tanacetum cinerariifolium TaxID=118510 RepID=A0A6L2P2C9_TANCI|nr:hypothetical protein [Tanacetum cinerariifolium]